jgi:hypothetical protein
MRKTIRITLALVAITAASPALADHDGPAPLGHWDEASAVERDASATEGTSARPAGDDAATKVEEGVARDAPAEGAPAAAAYEVYDPYRYEPGGAPARGERVTSPPDGYDPYSYESGG